MKVCVIVEGQLRAARTAGPTIKKYLVEELDADLYFYLHNDELMSFYGEYKDSIIYDNPKPDFGNIFKEFCITKGYSIKNWHIFKQRIHNLNYLLGYSVPGTCIRRMYNRHLIYNRLCDSDYDWFIITRSDMCFVDSLVTEEQLEKLDTNKIHVYEKGSYEGLNNNLILFHKNIFEKVCNYIDNLLSGNLYKYIVGKPRYYKLNEEKFFHVNILYNNVDVNFIPIKSYICGDSMKEKTTWGRFKIDKANNIIHKYNYDYDECKKIKNMN